MFSIEMHEVNNIFASEDEQKGGSPEDSIRVSKKDMPMQ